MFLSIAQEYNLQGIEPRTRIFKEQSQEQFARFIGKYDFLEYGGKANIIVKDDGLELTLEISPTPVFLWPESDNTFFSKNSGQRFNFILKNGLVTGIEFSEVEVKKIE